MRWRVWQSVPATTLASLAWVVAGCATLDAWKGALFYDHQSGQMGGELKGVGPGGSFAENTGLNFAVGDNTVPALLIAALLGVGILVAYPIQRKLRLWKEKKVKEDLKAKGEI